MKKLLGVLIFVAIIVAGLVIFGKPYIGVLTTNEIAKGAGVEVVSNKNGVLEGVLRKETLNKNLIEYVGKTIIDPAIRAEVIDELSKDETFKDDINFRYHYETSLNSFKPTIKGEIEVLDKDTITLFTKLFGSPRALSLEFSGSSLIMLSKDMNYKEGSLGLLLKTPKLDITGIDKDGGISGVKFSFSSLELLDLSLNDSFTLSGFSIINSLKTPYKSGDELVKFLSKDSTHELSIGEILYKDDTLNFNLKGAKYIINIDESLDAKSDIFDILMVASTQSLDVDSFRYGDDEINLTLSDINSKMSRKKDGDDIEDSSKFSIADTKLNVMGSNLDFKNFTLNLSSKISKSLYKLFVDSNFVDEIELMSDSEFMDTLAKNFGSGVGFRVDEISVQNHKGDKITAFGSLSIPVFSDIESGDMSMLNSIKSSLKISTTSSLAEFLGQTDENKMMGAFADMGIVAGYSEIKKEFNTSMKSEISNWLKSSGFDDISKRVDSLNLDDIFTIKENGAYELNLDESVIFWLVASSLPELASSRDDVEVSKTVTNLNTLISDINAYYISQGRLASKLYDMTNVPFAYEESGESGIYGALESNGKNCFIVTIKTLDDIFIEVTKGLDQEEYLCQKIYENQAAKYILNNKLYIKEAF